MRDWMHALAEKYGSTRARFPEEELLILFDIDGTILDARYHLRHLLVDFDRTHGTSYFTGLTPAMIEVPEARLGDLLERCGVGPERQDAVRRHVARRRWSLDAMLASHQPYRGVLDVIRWLQLQPRTHVGLNTGRPEARRDDTLLALNELGREYRVRFESPLLFMNDTDQAAHVPARKAEALAFFRARGYRVLAVVEDDAANIAAMAAADPSREVLFLHAELSFQSPGHPGSRAVRGRDYDLTSLASESPLPGHVQLVRRGVGDRTSLSEFLESPVGWAESPVRLDPSRRVVVRQAGYDQVPWSADEEPLELAEALAEVATRGRGLRLRLEGRQHLLERVLDVVDRAPVDTSCLGFLARIEDLEYMGFRSLATTCPLAAILAPVDFLVPLVLGMPDRARELLHSLQAWGITGFSVSWRTSGVRRLLSSFSRWGLDVDIRDVDDLRDFLGAALTLPASMTATLPPDPAGSRHPPSASSRRARAPQRSRPVAAA